MNQTSYFALRGGVNDVDPPIDVRPGHLLDAMNYEHGLHGGYRRVDGYERFDGANVLPSKAQIPDLDTVPYAEQIRGAQEQVRNAIAPVPGIGPIRGVVHYNNVVYAFRDLSATEGAMYRAGAPWTLVRQGLLPGGRYEFEIANFIGHTSGVKLYGVDGVNRAFEFDGTTYTPISTGMTIDAPIHLTEHKKHLFLAFQGGSLQHSGIGDPLTFNVILGAGEIGTADEITALVPLPGDVLMVGNRNRTYILHGSSGADFDLREHSDTTGVIEWSAQRIGNAIYADDRGLVSLLQVDTFGDFADTTFSQLVQKRFQALKRAGITASTIVRDKNQYRIFFEGGWALYVTYDNRRVAGILPIRFPDTVRTVSNDEAADGTEVLCFGSDDGYVYSMDSGTSFDGEPIEAYIRPVFNHHKSPDTRKRYRKVTFDFETADLGTLKFTPSFSFNDRQSAQPPSQTLALHRGGGVWDVDSWDEFIWHGQEIPRASAKIEGTGTNLGLMVYSLAAYEQPHTIYGATVHYSPRRLER